MEGVFIVLLIVISSVVLPITLLYLVISKINPDDDPEPIKKTMEIHGYVKGFFCIITLVILELIRFYFKYN